MFWIAERQRAMGLAGGSTVGSTTIAEHDESTSSFPLTPRTNNTHRTTTTTTNSPFIGTDRLVQLDRIGTTEQPSNIASRITEPSRPTTPMASFVSSTTTVGSALQCSRYNGQNVAKGNGEHHVVAHPQRRNKQLSGPIVLPGSDEYQAGNVVVVVESDMEMGGSYGRDHSSLELNDAKRDAPFHNSQDHHNDDNDDDDDDDDGVENVHHHNDDENGNDPEISLRTGDGSYMREDENQSRSYSYCGSLSMYSNSYYSTSLRRELDREENNNRNKSKKKIIRSSNVIGFCRRRIIRRFAEMILAQSCRK